jgi:hypothetical protein
MDTTADGRLMDSTADPRASHEHAVISVEARHLARVLAPYRVLHRDALEQVAGADRWHECSFARALAEAVRKGYIEALPGSFYSYVER